MGVKAASDEQWAERFWSKVAIRTLEECWLWKAKARSKKGYGIYGTGGRKGGRWGLPRQALAHRIAFMLTYGVVLPSSIHVLHRCDNPPCCNPEHGFLGVNQDNVTDKVAKRRQPRGETFYTHKLTEEAVREIRAQASGAGTLQLAKKFGVSHSTIYEARTGKTWKHVA